MHDDREGLLIIDDEEGIRRAIRKALSGEHYEILLAANGEEALAIVREHADHLAVVISDFKMPGMDGIQTLAAIHQLSPEATRILLTGYATLEGAIQATNEGIDGFLTKPFENDVLRAKIREYFIKRRLREFVSGQVLAELQQNPLAMRPKKALATVLFTDLRGFTAFSEKADPLALSTLLSQRYFTPLGEIIFANQGTLDKHIGDGIMALYGAPLGFGNDAYRAVKTAIEIRERMIEIDLTGAAAALVEGSPPLTIGIGIATGEMIVGLFGSNRKKEYTALGAAVNRAARLVNQASADQILIDEDTYRQLEHLIDAEALPPMALKGISEPVTVYSVRGLKAAQPAAAG